MHFFKYQGTGNDFIILDGRENIPSELDVQLLCDRRFGIGADGLMVLKNHPAYDFEMVYYNSDGNLSSMCGNGGRCLAHFANFLGIGNQGEMEFIAVDGPHHARVSGNYVELGMRDVNQWEKRDPNTYVLNTGSPHYVHFMDGNIRELDLISFARNIRYNDEFSRDGINVNVVHILDSEHILLRTYERGVEDETLSCGTGVTASALAFQIHLNTVLPEIKVQSMGGDLVVKSQRNLESFQEIILAGPAVQVYYGQI
ncbi:MAG: diaminopimelate epimerase [Bacteroidetes bacterium]|nr:diaminopimelate epimerase [Bacteroidota bacterium]